MPSRWTAATAALCALLLLPLLGACAAPTQQATTPPPAAPAEPATQSAEASAPAAEAPATPAPGSEPPAEGKPNASTVWRGLLSGEAYRAWPTAPGYDKPQPGKGPHGAKVKVFVDAEVQKTLDGGSAKSWPVGSRIVKDIFGDGGKMINIAYMQKTDAGWFYAEYRPGGDVVAAGTEIPGCADCHKQGSDSTRSITLP